jgi:hypothetical protein
MWNIANPDQTKVRILRIGICNTGQKYSSTNMAGAEKSSAPSILGLTVKK